MVRVTGLDHIVLNCADVEQSIGHPLELDRILGDERNFAGTSFVRPEMIGYITKGYHEGVSRLMTLMSAANKGGPDRQAVQAEAETEHSWESLMAHTRYMQLRSAHGMDQAARTNDDISFIKGTRLSDEESHW